MDGYNLIDIFYEGDTDSRKGELKKIFKSYDEYGRVLIERITLNEYLSLNLIKNSQVLNKNYINEKHGLDKNILEITYLLKGKMEMIVLPENKTYFIHPKDIITYINNENNNNFLLKLENLDAISLHIDLDYLNTFKDLISYKDYKNMMKLKEVLLKDNIKKIKANDKLYDDAKEILNFILNTIKDYVNINIKGTNLFTESVEYILKNITTGLKPEEEKIIKDIEKRIKKDLKTVPTIEDITSIYNISSYKLQKGFKGLYNSTYYDYIKKLRINKSKELLKNRDLTIIDISKMLGFKNPSKFSEHFKNITNITPTEYRINLNLKNKK